MKLPPIVQAGDPVLRAAAARVDPALAKTRDVQDLIATMIAVMRNAPGVGLAAPQIGVSLQIIVLEDAEQLMARLDLKQRAARERTPFSVKAILNPELEVIDAGSPRPCFFEGCLSVSGYMALVDRDREVVVTGFDEHGEPLRWQARGWPARILQHEVDHLRGTLYVDRMITRTFSLNQHVAERWMDEDPAVVKRALGCG